MRTEAYSPSGNDAERLMVNSGAIVAVDQYMLTQDRFLSQLPTGFSEALEATRQHGGELIELPAGEYNVHRDANQQIVLIYPRGNANGVTAPELLDEEELITAFKRIGTVFIETRCLVLLDVGSLIEGELSKEYRTIWGSKEQKRARDLVRENGGAVRYGFSPMSDLLGVFRHRSGDVLALWPVEAEGA